MIVICLCSQIVHVKPRGADHRNSPCVTVVNCDSNSDLMNCFGNYSLPQGNEDRQRRGGEGRKEERTVKGMKGKEKEK